MSTTSNSTVGAAVNKFKGSTSHQFMIWLAEWKKHLVYQNVHHIILDGLDTQGRKFDPLTNFKISEPEFFIEYYNNEVLKSNSKEMETVNTLILQECPWLIGYWCRKQLTINQIVSPGAQPTVIPTREDMLLWLEILQVTVDTTFPYPTLEVARTAPQLIEIRDARLDLEIEALAGVDEAIYQMAIEDQSIISNTLQDPRRRVNVIDVKNVVEQITHLRLLQRQFKNIDALEIDMDIFEKKDPQCDTWQLYREAKLLSNFPAYEKSLKDAKESNNKQSLKHSDQAKKCLDCLALLGDIKCIPNAESAIKDMDYHRCFVAVDNYYMRLGGQDTDDFKREAESYRIQPGQDLNSHLDLLQSSIERWLNIEHMELKLLQLGSTTAVGVSVKTSASKFVLDHPEVACDNSYDLSDVEITAKGAHSVILLSEAKRFTLYSNSVKSSDRFKRIVEKFHIEDESSRTVRALITSLRNFELSNSGSDLLKAEKLANPNWKKDLKSYLDTVMASARDNFRDEGKEQKSVSFAQDTKSHDKVQHPPKNDYHSKNNFEKKLNREIPHCNNHPKSNTHWTSECKMGLQDNSKEKPKAASKEKKIPTGKGGCSYCFNNEKLRKNSLNHTSEECKLNPSNGSKTKKAVNHIGLKSAIRDVLNEPAKKESKRTNPYYGLEGNPEHSDVSSDEDSEDGEVKTLAKNKKRRKN